MSINRGHWGRGSDGGVDGCSQPTDHSLAVDFSPFLLPLRPVSLSPNILTPAVSSHRPPLVTLFPTSVCPHLIPSFVFYHLSAKIQSTFFFPLPILAYTLLPCQSKYLFSQNSYPTIFPVFVLYPPQQSSFVGLPCLLTHASCHFLSLSLSPSMSLQSHTLFPCSSLLFCCRYHSFLQMPAAPHRGHVIQQSLAHSIHASSLRYFCPRALNA